MLKYATLNPDENLVYKTSELDSYEILQNEIKDTFGMIEHEGIDIWYDDNFLFKKEYAPTLIIKRSREHKLTDYDTLLCGPLVFTRIDKEGNTISLNHESMKVLKKLKPAVFGIYRVWFFEAYDQLD